MTTAIEINNLCVSYETTTALENISLSIPKGGFLGIIGPNGGGKSTLIKAILGLTHINSGSIKILRGDVKKNRSKIGYVPQFADVDRKFPITVLEVIMTAQLKGGFHPFFRYKKSDKDFAYEQLKRVGIEKLAGRQISDLSGGEFQRVLIARALAVSPEILLLDEPDASIDAGSREHVYELLTELNKDVTIVLVTHDLMAVSATVKDLACLNKTLVYHGEPSLTTDIVNKMYGCPVDLIAHGVPHRVLPSHKHGGE
ncbi:MAG: metal ABC transporter ATP-binding protein [Methanocorpusculum sp.]|nr:metal ABC transporter ATP-binding protein [Methanocorpusculum sp.]